MDGRLEEFESPSWSQVGVELEQIEHFDFLLPVSVLERCFFHGVLNLQGAIS